MIPAPSPAELAAADQDLADCYRLLDDLGKRHRTIVEGYREQGAQGVRPIGFHSLEMMRTISPHTIAVLLSISLHRTTAAAEAAEKDTARGDQ